MLAAIGRQLMEDTILSWTRVTDADEAAGLLPAWLGRRLIGLRGRFGLLLTTGDVLRITSLTAVHQSSDGLVLLDVLLDHAGVPEGIDLAWQSKHFLGAPVPGATLASVNLAQVVAAVEFLAEETVQGSEDVAVPSQDEIVADLAERAAGSVNVEPAAE